jgi:hypothetical protein
MEAPISIARTSVISDNTATANVIRMIGLPASHDTT